MKMQKSFAKAALLSAMLASGAASATTLVLPDVNVMTAGQYGDFKVYSFGLLQACAGSTDCPAIWGTVKSDLGAISGDVVILSKSGNNVDNIPTPFSQGAQVDDPFLAVSGAVTHFEMSTTNEPLSMDSNGTNQEIFGAGDRRGTWEISLDLLQGWLKNDLVFIFDNNQQGNNTNQNLWLWGQAKITDASGNQVGSNCFEVNSSQVSGCNAKPDPNDWSTKYLPVPGAFCVHSDPSHPEYGMGYNYGEPTNAGDCGNDFFVNNNLGQAEAEFAAFNKTLSDFVKDATNKGKGYMLSVDFMYANDNGGQEQLFICADCKLPGDNHRVPEPATLGLMGIGALGLAAAMRRRRTK